MLSRKIIFGLVLIYSVASPAGASQMAKVKCKVGSFDEKIVELNCDPSTNIFLRTPRSWIPKNIKLKLNELVEFQVTLEQLKKWPTLNKEMLDKKKQGKKS